MITQEKNKLIIKDGFGTVWIEPWGKDSVRVRMTADRKMDRNDWALEEKPGEASCSISIRDVDTTYPWAAHFEGVPQTKSQVAELTNGRLLVKINHEGWISFWKCSGSSEEPELLFEEQWRNRWRIDR
ncbi:MAG: hypothetical protein K5681_00495, partial [Treponema sp.]|nr:hypothetical protein [Treponema sp.]